MASLSGIWLKRFVWRNRQILILELRNYYLMANITHYQINGEPTPLAEAKLHVSDLGLLRGYGVFDYFLVDRSIPLFVADYLRRFSRSAELLQLPLRFTEAEIETQIKKLIAINKMENGAIRLLLTGGYSDDGFTPSKPNFVILAHPFKPLPASLYQDGTALVTDVYERFIPEVKTTNYLNSILNQPKLKAAGAVDVLYHKDGQISETSRSNFFLVDKENTIVTTPSGILPGVTRMKVLEIARKHYKVEERPIHLKEALAANEVIITGSNKKVLPIVRIDRQIIGDGRVGPIGRSLIQAFKEYTAEYVQAHTEASV